MGGLCATLRTRRCALAQLAPRSWEEEGAAAVCDGGGRAARASSVERHGEQRVCLHRQEKVLDEHVEQRRWDRAGGEEQKGLRLIERVPTLGDPREMRHWRGTQVHPLGAASPRVRRSSVWLRRPCPVPRGAHESCRCGRREEDLQRRRLAQQRHGVERRAHRLHLRGGLRRHHRERDAPRAPGAQLLGRKRTHPRARPRGGGAVERHVRQLAQPHQLSHRACWRGVVIDEEDRLGLERASLRLQRAHRLRLQPALPRPERLVALVRSRRARLAVGRVGTRRGCGATRRAEQRGGVRRLQQQVRRIGRLRLVEPQREHLQPRLSARAPFKAEQWRERFARGAVVGWQDDQRHGAAGVPLERTRVACAHQPQHRVQRARLRGAVDEHEDHGRAERPAAAARRPV
mmetsp:Transcript_41577/g.91385  ORF Transcript_41577/g.91385 Transcript_41577/m.91385 type:complete len:403 (+) Transcript_41577:327-1535(+)